MIDGHCYIGMRGDVIAIEKSTGRTLWHCSLKGSDYVMVAVDEDLILAYTGGHLFGVDRRRGIVLWENKLKGMGYGFATIGLPNQVQEVGAILNQLVEERKRERNS